MNPQAVTAVCVVLGLIGTCGMFVIKAVIQKEFEVFSEKLDARFAQKTQVEAIDARIHFLERRRGAARGD